MTHLQGLLSGAFPEYRTLPILFLVPCDSADTWIVAALDDFDPSKEYETIKDPWVTIISQGRYYHGVRISSGKKSKKIYEKLDGVVNKRGARWQYNEFGQQRRRKRHFWRSA